MYVITTKQPKGHKANKLHFYTAKTGGEIWTEHFCEAMQYQNIEDVRWIAACLPDYAFYENYGEVVKREHNKKLV